MPINRSVVVERMESSSRYSHEPIGSCWRGVIFGLKIELLAGAGIFAAVLLVHWLLG